jgi:uncharacterized protein YgiM (DUF1202 family)
MSKNIKKIIICSFIASTITTNVVASEMITNANVNFRNSPNLAGQKIKLLSYGSKVEVKETVEDWSFVTLDGEEGYIKSEFLSSELDIPIAQKAGNVELTPWSEVKSVFAIGENASVYDINSGKTYNVRSFSNGSHADVEPITHEDTRIMKETFNGVWSWDIKPVLVTVGGKTMAGSISGMPHGGGVNNNNGMNGQVCIHFLGSKVHNGNTSFGQLHQDYVMKAFNSAK